MEHAEILFNLFSGLNRVYGLYKLVDTNVTGEKVLGKPSTISGPVSVELWGDHLRGYTGLGIVPIKDGNTCSFGAIDIDVYKGLDIGSIITKIENSGMPLVPCMSKSGGLHCFCFLKEQVPAKLLREKLYMMASYLGFSGSEIYPKQIELLSDRGDFGQWINMPYFDVDKTTRYALNSKGNKLDIDQFISLVKEKRISLDELNAFSIRTLSQISDGPPCLQTLLSLGFIEGHRNEGLFNLALYLRKTVGDTWESTLQEYNRDYVKPPLSVNDVTSIAKSVKRHDYFYSCNKMPLKNYCNKTLCKTREFGVGFANGNITLSNLCKYNSQPPIWFVNVEEKGRLELATEDLQSQNKFQRRCMESLNIMPIPVKPDIWQQTLQKLMDEVNLIEVAAESSPKGLMYEYLEKFCTSRVQARVMDEILLGKPYTDESNHYFRLSDFYTFLERVRFKEFKIHQISAIIRENGGVSEIVRLKGKSLNIWKIPMFEVQTEKFDVPFIQDKEVM